MKKLTSKRLTVQRETIKRLDDAIDLGHVAGGGNKSDGNKCQTVTRVGQRCCTIVAEM
ncbi:MAG TPA: hypothetical protein VL463_34820 [Kofleriaceae bacterium]|nr:hypothetical protein [Kofleriaceae bacterium]